jgi:hypothetical protein
MIVDFIYKGKRRLVQVRKLERHPQTNNVLLGGVELTAQYKQFNLSSELLGELHTYADDGDLEALVDRVPDASGSPGPVAGCVQGPDGGLGFILRRSLEDGAAKAAWTEPR